MRLQVMGTLADRPRSGRLLWHRRRMTSGWTGWYINFISYGLKTALVVINGPLTSVHYRSQALQPYVVTFLFQHNPTLQQENARLHVARVCLDVRNTRYWDPKCCFSIRWRLPVSGVSTYLVIYNTFNIRSEMNSI